MYFFLNESLGIFIFKFDPGVTIFLLAMPSESLILEHLIVDISGNPLLSYNLEPAMTVLQILLLFVFVFLSLRLIILVNLAFLFFVESSLAFNI